MRWFPDRAFRAAEQYASRQNIPVPLPSPETPARYSIREEIDSSHSGEYTGENAGKGDSNSEVKVNRGQQNKHIPGTNEYKNSVKSGNKRSIMNGDIKDIQKLLDEKAGTGTMIGDNKERVDFGQVIGQYVNPTTGEVTDTTMGIIHYGNKGAHIVPARPNE